MLFRSPSAEPAALLAQGATLLSLRCELGFRSLYVPRGAHLPVGSRVRVHEQITKENLGVNHGGRKLEAHVRQKLGIGYRETDAAGDYTLEPVYCLGLCASGPAAMIDGRPVAPETKPLPRLFLLNKPVDVLVTHRDHKAVRIRSDEVVEVATQFMRRDETPGHVGGPEPRRRLAG